MKYQFTLAISMIFKANTVVLKQSMYHIRRESLSTIFWVDLVCKQAHLLHIIIAERMTVQAGDNEEEYHTRYEDVLHSGLGGLFHYQTSLEDRSKPLWGHYWDWSIPCNPNIMI